MYNNWLNTQSKINEYSKLLIEQQSNKCAVTGEELTRPVLDHSHLSGRCRQVIESKINLVEGKYLKLFNKYIKSHYDFGFADFLILLGEYLKTEQMEAPLHYKIIEAEKKRISRWRIETLYDKLVEKGLTLNAVTDYTKHQITEVWLNQFIKELESTI